MYEIIKDAWNSVLKLKKKHMDIFQAGRENLEDKEIEVKRDLKVSECHNELARKVSEMEGENGDYVKLNSQCGGQCVRRVAYFIEPTAWWVLLKLGVLGRHQNFKTQYVLGYINLDFRYIFNKNFSLF